MSHVTANKIIFAIFEVIFPAPRAPRPENTKKWLSRGQKTPKSVTLVFFGHQSVFCRLEIFRDSPLLALFSFGFFLLEPTAGVEVERDGAAARPEDGGGSGGGAAGISAPRECVGRALLPRRPTLLLEDNHRAAIGGGG